MATFFSASADQRDVGGDMPFHYFPPFNLYSESSTVGLVPLPATTIASENQAAQGDSRNELAFMSATEEPTTSSTAISLQRQLMMMNGQADASAMQHHGLLSLSLGTQVPVSFYQCRPGPPGSADASFLGPHQPMAASTGVQTGVGVQNSQYLKAGRELLDELVNVQHAIVKRKADKNQSHSSGECKDADQRDDKASNRQESAVDSSPAKLSPLERQDLQNKVTALLAMLDQVDQRYRHYHQQMQALASSLDAAAGRGAARPYTTLALQTISRHFRSLRDAIGAQVQSTCRSLGEPDAPAHGGGIHRLRYIDQQFRQQRAAQQFGMLPHQLQQQQQPAWRPQRGLPESAVSVLRAWLFEHFLHPYPKDSEKLMLARQTGLTRGQVSNWFINARVRLWKPMIEEMYKEEFGAEMESNSSSENGAGKGKDEPAGSSENLQSPSSAAVMHGVSQLSPFRSEAMASADAVNNAYSTAGLSLQEALAHHSVGGGSRFLNFGTGVAGLGGYEGDRVSLTLGLHRHDSAGGVTIVTAEQQGLAPVVTPVVRGDCVYPGAFEYMDGPDDRQQSGSSSQLLHDFVT